MLHNSIPLSHLHPFWYYHIVCFYVINPQYSVFIFALKSQLSCKETEKWVYLFCILTYIFAFPVLSLPLSSSWIPSGNYFPSTWRIFLNIFFCSTDMLFSQLLFKKVFILPSVLKPFWDNYLKNNCKDSI